MIELEPMTARDLFIIGYIVFVVYGGLYVFSRLLSWAESRKRGKRKRDEN